MTKTILSLALLSSCIPLAQGEVILYGTLDMRVSFEHQRIHYNPLPSNFKIPPYIAIDGHRVIVVNGAARPSNFSPAATTNPNIRQQLLNGRLKPPRRTNQLVLTQGWYEQSHVGIKGEETLGQGLNVGFKLETGFNPLNGALMDPDHFFDREASIHLTSRYGTLYAGRLGELKGSVGSVGFFANEANPFGSGWGEVIGGIGPYGAQSISHLNNAIAYVSPEIQGLTLYAQYSGGQDNVQNQSIADRTYALGAKFKHGPLTIAGVLDTTQIKTSKAYRDYTLIIRGRVKNYHVPRKNPLTLNLAANLELQDWKLFASMQMFKNVRNVNQSITGDWIPPNPIRPSELFYMAHIIDSLFYRGPYASRMEFLGLNKRPWINGRMTRIPPTYMFALADTINESIKYNGLSLTTGFTAEGNSTPRWAF